MNGKFAGLVSPVMRLKCRGLRRADTRGRLYGHFNFLPPPRPSSQKSFRCIDFDDARRGVNGQSERDLSNAMTWKFAADDVARLFHLDHRV